MSLTAANAVITLANPILFPVPVQLQGFAADDVFDVDQVKVNEVVMGVDGFLSAGFVWNERTQNITLQGDSASNDFFDTLNAQQEATQDSYELQGIVVLLGIATKFAMTRGFLTMYSPTPPVKKIIQPRRYQITWQRIAPLPA